MIELEPVVFVSATELTIYIIWWAVLVIAVLVIVPATVTLLHRGLRAARQIEHYSARTLEAGVGIAGNTAAVAALQDTIGVATGILGTTEQIEAHSRAMKEVLASRLG